MRAINIKNTVVCFIHEQGMMLSVEDSRSVKAMAYLKLHLFHEFRLKEADVSLFALPIDSFINCLQVTVPQSSDNEFAVRANDDYCEISYDGTGSYLSLRRHISNKANLPQTIHCELIPYEPDEESPELQIGDSTEEVPQRMIIKSDWFSELMNDLDSRYNKITLTISPHNTAFQVIAEGSDLLTESDYPEDSEPFISFTCTKELSFSYLYSHLVQCKKALDISYEVSIEMFDSGALRLYV
ncbi:Rad1/Rec1/Rad17, partial [Gilbertella persicaria]|uniref:Rad1/Rec1/Rad17 n=1 Tax=Gilbertella persicaria TaxID=101096 RepID=UPI00221F7558